MMDGVTPLRGNEKWCSAKLLGSLMCSTKDILKRCTLGNVAFQSFSKVWLNSRIPLVKKLKVYEAQVISVIMYNCSSWAAPDIVMKKLDICHRKHLRKIMNVRWPCSMMSNNTLYRRCESKPLSERVKMSRWKMLGHVLRSPENSPAHSSLCFAVDAMKKLTGRKGRHRINLLHQLKKDLLERGYVFETYENIVQLRQVASDRLFWRNLF